MSKVAAFTRMKLVIFTGTLRSSEAVDMTRSTMVEIQYCSVNSNTRNNFGR